MIISYNWLHKYLPQPIDHNELSNILTSIGLEVESLEKFETIEGGLEGLVVGEVLTCKPHPNADKLKVTEVKVDETKAPLQIVCGAANVAAGQKVIVALPGTVIRPLNAQPVHIKNAVIRGQQSSGMLCAEDEIGISADHSGIIVLKDDAVAGSPASDYFDSYTDWIYEIGLTPNRIDAMSHIGTAKDVCAWLSFHQSKVIQPVLPYAEQLPATGNHQPIKITIENTEACKRYAGISITNVKVAASPVWMQNYLKAIGQRPINNIVDITNFVLNEMGQPLHAFDLTMLSGQQVVVKTLPDGSVFTALDGTERKLNSGDLMVCDSEKPVAMAGVFGGLHSGVSNTTTAVFLESAWFDPTFVRKTSLRHNLRTEAATHFEKGVDISNTVKALQRAAALIAEIAGGEISTQITDVYPAPAQRRKISFSYAYLKKLSGRNYKSQQVKNILLSLDFEILEESDERLLLSVPFSKYDIYIPADIVEEIVRIDGLDNIEIPSDFSFTPSLDESVQKESLKEKVAGILTGLGFKEIITNSITNSRYYTDEVLKTSVHMLNSLSADLDVMKPSSLETGLESIAYNINRKNANLALYEFGKTYRQNHVGDYTETDQLSIWLTGNAFEKTWNTTSIPHSYFELKGIIISLLQNFGLTITFGESYKNEAGLITPVFSQNAHIGNIIEVGRKYLKRFDIEQDVLFANLEYIEIFSQIGKKEIRYSEISKYQPVERDLSMIIDKNISYSKIQLAVTSIRLPELLSYKLFDVFESEKIGNDKKSMAIRFTFLSAQKTLTDVEIEILVQKIIKKLEKDLLTEIRTK